MTQINLNREGASGPSGGDYPPESLQFDPSSENRAGRVAAGASPQSKSILVADDDASVRQMLSRVLESEQYTVLRAQTGREAAVMFLSAPPDLVLLDLNMPDRDGWEALQLINAVNPMIPVIIITAQPSQYEQGSRVGADALMEKPLHLSLLLGTIHKFLTESEAERMHRLNNPHFKTLYLSQNRKAA